MEILIKKITTGTRDRFGNIYETWVHGFTNNGYEIKAEVIRDYDLQPFIGKTIECLMLAYRLIEVRFEQELQIDLINNRIFGKYKGEYNIPKVWTFKDITHYDAISTLDGIILLYPNEVKKKIKDFLLSNYNTNLKIGNIISFYPEKFELLDYRF